MIKTRWLTATILGLALSLPAFAETTDTSTEPVTPPTKEVGKLPLSELQQFSTVMNYVKSYYVEAVTEDNLIENAIRGMLSGLDPHSAYLDKDEYQDLKVSTSGKFGGVGIEVAMEDGFIRVVSPIDDTPAQISGVKAGDLIIRLDDTPVKGLTLRKAVEMMRGNKGEPIVLTIIRQGETKPLKITVVRDIIQVKSVKNELLEPNFGLIRITQFQNKTGENVVTALNDLKAKNKGPLNGLILDLRNNPGGIMDASVSVVNAFLEKDTLSDNKLIVYTKGRLSGSDIKEFATGHDYLKGAPIVVLVNGGSASASEIVAGALQDHKRAVLMGKTTFGKGSVQTVLPLKGDTGIKLTTALYYTPNGRSIQATGIVPDIEVDDLKISKTENNDDQALLSMREADLKNHLAQQQKEANVAVADDANVDKKATNTMLMARDYQMQEALNLLKAMAILNNKK